MFSPFCKHNIHKRFKIRGSHLRLRQLFLERVILLLRFRQLCLQKSVLISKRKAAKNISEETENPIEDFANNAKHLNLPRNAQRRR